MSVWDIDTAQFKPGGSMRDKMLFWLGYATLAPSPHNNQPWQVQLADDHITLRPDLSLVSAGTPRLTVLCLGAFVENFCTAAAHWGHAVSVSSVPQAVSLATLTITLTPRQGANPVETPAFGGMTLRHTNRGLYDPAPLNPNILEQLRSLTGETGTTTHLVTDADTRKAIAQLAGLGMRAAVTLPPLRRELARFVYWQHEHSDLGMFVEAMVREPQPTPTGSEFILKTIDIPAEARFTYEKFANAPLQVVVTTPQDDATAWFSTGRTVQRLLNTAAALGLTHCIAAAPTEIPPFVPRLKKLLNTQERPQLVLRLGIPLNATFTHHSARRPVSSIVHD
jgi:nitroreductase